MRLSREMITGLAGVFAAPKNVVETVLAATNTAPPLWILGYGGKP